MDIEYDSILNCWCLHYAGEVICLGATTQSAAETEAAAIVDSWQ